MMPFIIFYCIITYIIGLGIWVAYKDEPPFDFFFFLLSPITVPFAMGYKIGKQ